MAKAQRASAPLTAQDYYRFLQCPHWPYWERFGNLRDRRALTEAEEERLADGLEHEKRVVKAEYPELKTVRVTRRDDGFRRTLDLMRAGVPAIYQGWLMDGDRVGRPDLLERRTGKSRFGNWYYVPVDVKRAHELRKEHKAQLTFYATLLEKIQGIFPQHPEVINGDGERLSFDAEEFLPEFRTLTELLERIRGGERPEPVYRKSCTDVSPWGEACFRLAKAENDIALLFNVDVRRLRALRDAGIRTVDDAADMDPSSLEGTSPGLTLRSLQSIQRQARSLREQVVLVKEGYKDPTKGLELHFDIESHPPTDTDYLYGLLVRGPEGDRYLSFVAERPEDEGKMWRAFLAWLSTLPKEFTVFHYAAYEPQRLGVLSRRYGDEGHPDLERFVARFVDLKEDVRDHLVFPLYFYSLKSIGKFLGFAWKGNVKGGGDSIVAYDKWLKSKRRSILTSIVDYNREDVQATAFLLDWMRAYAAQEREYREPYPWSGKRASK